MRQTVVKAAARLHLLHRAAAEKSGMMQRALPVGSLFHITQGVAA
jgi:hypothetical protein